MNRTWKDFFVGLAIIVTAPVWLPCVLLWCVWMGVCDIGRLRV